MDKHTIRTSKTDSVKGVASKQYIDVNLLQTTKNLPYPNVSSTLSQRSVYEQERQAGNKFRLILTIMPYCTNVLFNPLTEIIKNEGSPDKIEVITDSTKAAANNAIGNPRPTRVHMISNTEYSSEKHGGYDYHPGYDFFDNHLLRNQSFKVVNINLKSSGRDIFNTLSDLARDRNGETTICRKRNYINDVSHLEGFDKHLYLVDDILKIDESINQNLYNENGWWGFTNNTTIDPKSVNKKVWESLDIGKALNNYKACEFIDMYPDRTLYSFSPKFNKFTHEHENNWNVVLTYPYKNIYDHPICLGGSSYIKRTITTTGEISDTTVSEGSRWMGLKVMNAELVSGKAGGTNIIFRTYTKHGLEQGNQFYLYYTNPYEITDNYTSSDKFSEKTLNGEEIYYETENYYSVTNIGDMSREHNDYMFYSSNINILKELYYSFLYYAKNLKDDTNKSKLYELYKNDNKKGIYDTNDDLKTDLLNEILKNANFRIRRCVRGVKSTYYIRQFRKIPNLCAAQREITEEESLHKSKFNGVFENFIADNALDPTDLTRQRDFKKESYQLGFAANIYNDNAAQITFTDGVDIKGLTDNLGRPLSEIYYTIVKNNAGNEVWYDSKDPIYKNKELEKDKKNLKEKYGVKYENDYKIEFSHCFGRVTSGFEMYVTEDDSEDSTAPLKYWKKLGSVVHIANVKNTCSGALPAKKDEDSEPLEENINFRDTFFYGDLVEYNPIEFAEKQLSKVMHRFNTAQRETINNDNYAQYQYHEIISDDYDIDDFRVVEYSGVGGVQDDDMGTKDFATITRPEGYYYQAHYPIRIRQFTNVLQDAHYTLSVKKAKPVQQNGILIQITTSLAHKLSPNDIIYICNDESDTRYIAKCVQVINRTTFLMTADYDEYILNATDFEDIEYVSNLNEVNYKVENYSNKGNGGVNRYKNRFSWLELCNILNGLYKDDISYPTLTLRRKNVDIPDYATYIGGNQYLWKNVVNIGDANATELDDFIFANGYFYVTNRINFYLKRQDPFGRNGLYFDGDTNFPCFPNDPAGEKQADNYYITKDTSVSC